MKYLLTFFLFLTACASTYEVTQTGRTLRTADEYMATLEKNSDKLRTYSGFYNVLDVESVVLNSQMTDAQLDQSARIYQWDENKYAQEKQNFEGRLNRESEFFVSFFTPERKNDDLSKSNTVWRIFLDVDGRRFEGKATKIKLPLAEVQGLYPFHNRFASPYKIIFPVPMHSIEGKQLKLTMTGPAGSGVMTFTP